MGNPVNAFMLIKHLTSDFRELQTLVAATLGWEFMKRVNMTKKHFLWPTEEDLNGAAAGLFRLQDTYIPWQARSLYL